MRRRRLWAAIGAGILALIASCKDKARQIGWGAGTR